MRVSAKQKKKAKARKTAQTVSEKDLLVEQPSLPVSLKKYMHAEWFKTVEEEEDEEEVLYSYRMVIVDIDFQERSHTIIFTYRYIEDNARVDAEVQGLDGEMSGSINQKDWHTRKVTISHALQLAMVKVPN